MNFFSTLSEKLFLKASIKAFFIQGSSAVFIFLSSVILARLLDPEGYGIYVTVYSWYDFFALVALFGFHQTIVKFGPKYLTEGESEKFKGLFLYANAHVLFISMAICFMVILLLSVFDFGVGQELYDSLVVGLPLIPILALSQLYQGSLRSYKKFVKADFPHLVLRYLITIAGIVLFYQSVSFIDAENAVLIAVAGAVGSFALGLYWISKQANIFTFSIKKSEYRIKPWLGASLSIFIIMGAQFLMRKSDILMLSALSGTKSAGLYQVATQLTFVLVLGLLSVNMIIAPYISEYYSQDDHHKLKEIITKSTFLIFLFSAIVGGVLWFWGDFFLSLFGEEFQQSLAVLKILILGRLVNAIAGSTGLILMMTNYHHLASILTVIGLAINLTLNFILIPLIGIEGAAISTAVSGAFVNILMVFYIKKHLKINSTIFSKQTLSLVQSYV